MADTAVPELPPATLPPGWVTIPPNEMYSELRGATTAIAGLTLEVAGLREDLKTVSVPMADLDKRVSALEARIAPWLGPAGGLAGLVALANALWPHLH